MRFVRLAAALGVGVASLVAGQNLRQNRDKTARQYYGYSNSNNNNGYSSVSSSQAMQQPASAAPTAHSNGYANDYTNYQQQYGFYDNYGSASDYAQDYAPAATFGSGVAENPDSSPALSALALLGFLYFLNLIQDVLQNNNGRRRRSLTPLQDAMEGDQLKPLGSLESLDEEQLKPSGALESLDEEQLKPSGALESLDEEQLKYLESVGSLEEDKLALSESAEPEKDEQLEEIASDRNQSGRRLSFFENLFIRLPQALGLVKKNRIDRNGRDEASMTVGGFLTSRLKMISSIMNFLRDPSPLRVRRSLLRSDQAAARTAGDGERPEAQDPRRSARSRRFTRGMNAWYGDLLGRNAEGRQGAGGMAAKVVSALGGGRDLQAAASAEAVPALLEATLALSGGAHPHCLQRVLCRISAQQQTLSLAPRLALQLLSNKLAEGAASPEDHLKAVAAGRRGEDCGKSFPHCRQEPQEEPRLPSELGDP
ncbi:uncharacterized protein LOC119571759 [Penaeus monodon]|uniref:uncharacterized protein LOC119571759 n=1 Tax=Penaeus monodon TaxID=6687 RepID=UPI0018A782EF|nr:uncharacterized protein LOC119571759 [Penaeus monodon]XP_037774849.1 uncharacterized protein LOC119571759 [Penaeus monodon]